MFGLSWADDVNQDGNDVTSDGSTFGYATAHADAADAANGSDASMGMGMGMGMVPMGLGMGMMDMQQGRAVMPMQSHGGPAMNGNMASTSSLGDVHDYRYQTPVGVMDSYNAYLARQHQPMQMNPVSTPFLKQLLCRESRFL